MANFIASGIGSIIVGIGITLIFLVSDIEFRWYHPILGALVCFVFCMLTGKDIERN